MRLKTSALFFISALAFGICQAEDPVIEAAKLTSLPVIDGQLNEGEWSSAATFENMFDWFTGAVDPVPAQFWLGYDSEYIYFAAKLSDPNPSSVQAVEYRTNVGLSGDDNVTLRIDPTGTKEEANEFSVNASTGSSLSIAGGRALKREWLGEFQSKGRITESGWEVEAKIPWKLMQLPDPGKRNARINVLRYHTKTQRRSIFRYTAGEGLSFARWQGVEIPKPPFEQVVKLLPYAYAGSAEGEKAFIEGGLDVKTSLTPRLELIGTVNPDFRNVEGDILSLDFSYLERLARDRRPFFQEGANYWSSGVFTSQRVGRFDFGTNVYGRLTDRLSLGTIATFDPGLETIFATKAGYDVSKNRTFQLAVSNVSGILRPDNTSAVMSVIERRGPFNAVLAYARTDDDQHGEDDVIQANLGYGANGWGVRAEYVDVGENFFPRMGGLRERDFKGLNVNVEYLKPIPQGPLMEWNLEFYRSSFQHQDGSPYRSNVGFSASATLRNGIDIDMGVDRGTFEKNTDGVTYVSVEYPRGSPYRFIEANYTSGNIAGEKFRSAGLSFAYRPLKNLQLSLSHESVNHFEIDSQSILSANYDMGRDMSISGRLVRRDDKTSAYFSWRKAGNRGAEYYVIVGDPNSESFKNSLIVKAVVPLEWKP